MAEGNSGQQNASRTLRRNDAPIIVRWNGYDKRQKGIKRTTRCRTAIAHRTRSLPCPASEPTFALSQMWRPHGGHRETYGCPNPTPFSTLPRRSLRMIRKFRSPLLGASHHPPAGCALLAPKPAPHFQPYLKLSPQPHAPYHQTNPLCPVVNSSPSSRSLSHHPNTIQFA